MTMEAPAPPEPQAGPWQPQGSPEPLVMEDFEGIDTASSRYGVDPKKCYWIDGWLRIGRSRLRTLPDVGAAIYTTPGPAVVLYNFANLAGNPIAVIFLADGSIWQLRTDTLVLTQMAPAGTILSPSGASVSTAQWGSQYIIIIANQTNGYWLWDGNFLFGAGSIAPGVTLTYTGAGYTGPPTVTAYGGSGSNATFTAQINAQGQVTGVSITNPGTGYLATDQAGISFAGNVGHTAILLTSINAGTVSSISIANGGAGYQNSKPGGGPSAVLTIVGGGGAGATASVTTVGGGAVIATSITNGGEGYVTPPTVLINDPNNNIATATVEMMPFGIQGNDVATFQGRVWTINGATYNWTAPGSVVDFSAADGGGGAGTTASDACLRVGFVRLMATNGFLYLIGDSSIFYISGVQTSGTPIETTFSYQNADPQIGSNWPASVQLFSRTIVFANPFGAHALLGAAVSKNSEELDGVYNTVPNFNGLSPSAAVATVFGKKLWCLLLPIVDPISLQRVNKILIWDGRNWFASVQSVNFIFINSQEINSVLTAYGTDGTSIYPLFQTPSTNFSKTVQSKLWGAPGGYQFVKTTGRIWALLFSQNSQPITVQGAIDNEQNSSPVTLTLPSQTINVVNASGTVIPCKNASLVTIPVVSTLGGNWVTAPQAIGQQGALVGMTVTTSAGDVTLESVMGQQEMIQYRG